MSDLTRYESLCLRYVATEHVKGRIVDAINDHLLPKLAAFLGCGADSLDCDEISFNVDRHQVTGSFELQLTLTETLPVPHAVVTIEGFRVAVHSSRPDQVNVTYQGSNEIEKDPPVFRIDGDLTFLFDKCFKEIEPLFFLGHGGNASPAG